MRTELKRTEAKFPFRSLSKGVEAKLRKAGFASIFEVANLTPAELLETRGCGLRSLREVRRALTLEGLRMRGEG